MMRLFTIGHSNRSFEDFLSLLKVFKVCVVADIRRYPSSRKFPHFNREALLKLLSEQNIRYIWLEALGGRRYTPLEIPAGRRADASSILFLTGYTDKNDKSPNSGLKSPGFRNYADHMITAEFRVAVQELLSTAATSRTAVMCAEKFYWKCHRKLLSDYLTAQGVEVKHIVEAGKLQPHSLSLGAVITNDAGVIYPPSRLGKTQTQTLFES